MKLFLTLPIFIFAAFTSYAQPEELRVVRSLNLNDNMNLCLWAGNGLNKQIINAIESKAVKPYSINHYAAADKKFVVMTLDEVHQRMEIPQYDGYEDEEGNWVTPEKLYYRAEELYIIKITETAQPGKKKMAFKPAYLTLCISSNQSIKGLEEYVVSVLADEFLVYLKNVNASCATPGISKPEDASRNNEFKILEPVKNDTLKKFYSKLLTGKWNMLLKSPKSLQYDYIIKNRLYHGPVEYFSNPKKYYISDICMSDEPEISAAVEYAVINSKNYAHDFFLIFDKYKTACKDR